MPEAVEARIRALAADDAYSRDIGVLIEKAMMKAAPARADLQEIMDGVKQIDAEKEGFRKPPPTRGG